jgi:predicted transcriptional regulator
MAPRRSPDVIALDLLNCVEENGEATKWDLIKVLGNEAQFGLWIERFFLPERVLVERREGRRYYYKKTERGELFHKLLRTGNLIKLFSRVSGRRLR